MVFWRRHRSCWFLCFVLLFYAEIVLAQAGKIQWADQLIYQYNNYHEKYFSGQEALGPPDAFPPGHLNQNAFRLKTSKSYGTLVLGLSQPQIIRHLIVVENNEPGRLVQVKVKDTEGAYHLVYKSKAEELRQDFRTLVVSMPRTPYKVVSIELNINCILAPGIYQVDAVGVLDENDLSHAENELAGANFNIEQEFTFSEEKELLGDAINSKYTEIKPLVSHDGSTLYFSRMTNPRNYNGMSDPQDIYYSKYLNGAWTQAYNAGPPLNDELANGICSVTPDGRSVLLINGYGPHGRVVPGVSISHKTPSGWTTPEKIQIDEFENKSKYQDFYLSPDGKVIIMAIQNKSSVGEQDLFISKKIGPNHFGIPENLGNIINTTEAEFAPFIAFDNKTLFFASEGHGGYGQSDIYKSVRQDDTWLNWSVPKNMGPSINTSSWDAYFSITATGDYAYFVSSEGSRDGRENIYRIPLMHDTDREISGELISFTGRVVNADNGLPVFADVLLKNIDTHKPYRCVSDKVTGEYNMFLPPEGKMHFSVKAPGYIAYESTVDLSDTEEGSVLENVIRLKPIEAGQVVSLKDLFFERGKANILDKSLPTLDRLLQLMMENPSLTIELAGHTDGVGSMDANLELSQDRVERVKDYLVQFGIDRNRIETVGYGGRYPLAPSNTEKNRAKNRRVEVKILEISS